MGRMYADFDLSPDGKTVTPSHGGARPGAGRKPAGYVKPQEVVDFETARARNEAAKADLNELEFKIKSGEYVARDAVRQAAATMLATIAQALRSLPDTLERKCNMQPSEAELVERAIDTVLEGLSEDLRMLTEED